MKNEGDPLETLRRINPVDPSTLPEPARSREALDVMERILRGDVGSPERRRFRWLRTLGQARRRPAYLVPIVAVAVLAAGTLAWALARGPTQHLNVGCYAAIALDARTAVVSATEASPVETCREVWLDAFGKPPPPLQACVLPSGAVGVFPSPGGDSCERLSLVPGPSKPAPPVVELQNTLVDTFLARCVSESDARRIVLAELRRLRLEDWRVVTSGRFGSTRPCASLAFDEERSHVLLVPILR